jgi:hypothetical protein
MIRALGVSHNPFDPADPGRLCRGRERWIEPWPTEPGQLPGLWRLVVSGAEFSDDSARDARRGVPFSGLDPVAILQALFPRKALLAFMEDGHPADIPEGAEGVEAYSGHRAGGRAQEPLVRWYKRVEGVRELRELIGNQATDGAEPVLGERIRGFAVLDGDADADLIESLFLLVGMSTLDSPPAYFQPAALPEVLERVPAVVLLHRDKHGPAFGVYAREEIAGVQRLRTLCEKEGVLYVPFAIPPMLARWDRALADLRAEWLGKGIAQEFPVPPAPEPSGWEPRRRRRRGRDRDSDLEELPVATMHGDVDEALSGDEEEEEELSADEDDEVVEE